ncbi:glycosyltransferase family 2 protein [Devosia sp. LjRoot16]|uniref:glycosyltransferase family 2 protein n=1 Tax=Devosia sp. LjRoot16 TaxID=3342271 RepID=UPI003ED0CED9
MIVKNEQPFLDGCLKSLYGLVDEIVIVDTGSTDASIDIAQAHGVRLLNYAWHDDFAAARNFGLDAAGSEWILYIDADERLVETTRDDLRAGLDASDAYAARLLFRVSSNSTLYREFRLFRNDPRLRFKGAMHETILPDLAVLQREGSARVVDSAAKLIHLGYDGDMTAKYRRNLPLLRTSVERDPDRSYYWKDLADTLAGLGEIEEAIAAVEEGLARARASGRVSRVRHSTLIYTQARLREQRGEDMRDLIDAGLSLHPQNWSLLFLRARARINAGALEAAIDDLRLLLAQDPETIVDDVAHDQRIFGAYAHDLMGVALLRLGERAEAAAAFARAARAAPGVQEYRVKAMALGGAAALA